MKKLTITLLASIALAASSFAGHEVVSSGKDFKQPKEVAPITCFGDTELQLDVFGAYVVGEGPNHAGPVGDHGWGGGIGVNYFFSRYIGVGAEGYWIAADHNKAASNDGGETTFHNIGGSLIFRLPIDELCLAPYAFIGGGAVLDGDQWAVGFAGLGVEYRVIPNKLGLFVDGRFNYFFSRYIGVGAEGYWISSDHNGSQGTDEETWFHNLNGSIIFRLPIDELCLAPYAFIGGGAVLDGDQWAVGFAGVGVEYRVIPNKLGLFIDARWNYYGDRYGHDDQNNFTSRAGVRWVF
jgi:hypothetical protein